ncbi:MAG: KpsF/GutQ family sugar-phosphate isomerase [Deltaproteobacteria bacterium]|nr:KpsF/GutQ family sugar-phosphate isomerase [Deltaproteobacteria bacterium]
MAKKAKRIKKDETIAAARRTIAIEAEAVASLKDRIGGDFKKAVDLILSATGKVVVTGMGKSGIICQKIASTLASTGTPAFFLHPAEGVHGDLGMLMKNDVLLAVSNSGETEEILKMLPAVKRLGVKLIAMTGRNPSALAGYADVAIDIGVGREACPMGLAPTASTTAALAMGDALAVALLKRRGFREDDFATLHPSGSLGKKFMKVKELMHTDMPSVGPDARMKDAILEMTAKRLGLTGVFKGRRLVGVITDGDLRRALERGVNVFEKKASEVMTKNPRVVSEDALAEAALGRMEEHSITALFVAAPTGSISGVIHLHDLIKAGVV